MTLGTSSFSSRLNAWRTRSAKLAILPVAVAFATGAGLHACVPNRPVTWLGLAVCFALLALTQLRRDLICSASLIMLLALTGIADAQLAAGYFPANHIGQFVSTDRRLSQLRLVLLDDPRLISGEAELRKLFEKQVARARVTSIKTTTGWIPSSGDIALSIEPPNPGLRAGESLEAIGWLSPPQGAANPGEFDYAAYDRRQRILADFQIRRAGALSIITDQSGPFLARWRGICQRLLYRGASDPQFANAQLLDLVLLGEPNQSVAEIRDDLIQLGCAYLLSISGLHIAFIGAIVFLLARVARLHPRNAILLGTLAMLIYASAALPTTGGVRSLIMGMVGAAALLSGRRAASIQLLAIAVLAILIFRPLDLADAGFQISIAAVAGIILFAQPVNRWLLRIWKRNEDPWAAVRQRHDAPIAHLTRFIIRSIVAAAVVSCVAWAAIVPLVAWHFGQSNVWSIPAGLVLLPVTLLTLSAAAVKILLTAVLPFAAHPLAILCAVPAGVLRHAALTLAHLPGASHPMPRPSFIAIATYYALLLAPLIRWPALLWRRTSPAFPCFSCVCFLLFPTFGANLPGQANLRVTLLSIGAGQVAFVQVPYGENFFIDCGSTTIPDVYRRVIEPYLLYEGVTRVDEIFLSHGDYDHISAATEIAEAFGSRDIRMTPFYAPHAVGIRPAEGVLNALQTDHRAQVLDVQGDTNDAGDGAKLNVLWPPANCTMNSNDCGMVLRLTYAGRSILFPADIQVQPELALGKDPAALRSDVLIAPHHGSAETSTPAFLKSVSPRWIIASNAQNLTHKQKVFDDDAKAWKLYRTSQYGAITIQITPGGEVSVETFKP